MNAGPFPPNGVCPLVGVPKASLWEREKKFVPLEVAIIGSAAIVLAIIAIRAATIMGIRLAIFGAVLGGGRMLGKFPSPGIRFPTFVRQRPLCGRRCSMTISKSELLRETLGRDLNPAGSKETVTVVDDPVRKIFTVNKDGAVWVFGHSQSDVAYWNGVKHYGSGPSSRVRIRRTPALVTKLPKAKKARRPGVGQITAEPRPSAA